MFSHSKNLSWCAGLLALSVLIFSGCGSRSERLDRRDERDPLIIRGDARKRAGDVDAAIELYQQALDRNPRLALAHLKLGVEFNDHRRNYLRAIYHFERYMELRPTADKNRLVQDLINEAHVRYLSEMPNPPPGAIERIAILERENQHLKRQVDTLTEQASATRSAAASTRETPSVRESSARRTPTAGTTVSPAPSMTQRTRDATTAAPRMYQVQRGDTLSRIAAQHYQDSSQWNRIFEANRDVLSTPDSVREGQQLVIP